MRHWGAGRRAAPRLAVCLSAALTAIPVAAGAQGAAGAFAATRAPLAVHLRLVPTFLMLSLSPGDGIYPSEGGLTVALERPHRWLIEAGSTRMPWKGTHNDELGADFILRGGLLRTLRDGRDGAGKGWTLEGLALAGYIYLVRDIGNDASHDPWPHHGLTVTFGLEGRRYLSQRIAASLRLFLGPALLMRQRLEPDGMFEQPTGSWQATVALDVGLDLGLIF